MIICDFCTEPIDQDRMNFASGLTADMTVPLQVQLHPECLTPFATEVKKIRGKRPPAPPDPPQVSQK